jgi:hypothetical protein
VPKDKANWRVQIDQGNTLRFTHFLFIEYFHCHHIVKGARSECWRLARDLAPKISDESSDEV